MSAEDTDRRGYRMVVLAALLVVYTLNYIDRQIVGILAVPIKQELGLSDTQLGLLGGFAFAIFYATMGVPIARLADRYSRKRIIATSLVLWSGFTALCGAATGFWAIFMARLGVGVGEAGGVAPSFSLVADYFPPHQRGRALAALTLALPLGSAIGLFAGGYLAANYGWRTAFYTMGAIGLLVAPPFLLIVREPRRGRLDAPATSVGADISNPVVPSLREVFDLVRRKPSFWLIAFGSSAASMMTYGLGFWLPAFSQRSLNLDLRQTAQFLSAAALIGGVAGILIGGFLGDWLAKRDRAAYARVSAVAFLVALPAMVLAVSIDNLAAVFALLLIPQAMGLVWAAPSVTIIQHLAPASMRATALALYLLVVNFIGLGLGTVVFGVLSDLLADRFGDASLRYAILICCTVLYPLASGLYLLAGRFVARDWHVG